MMVTLVKAVKQEWKQHTTSHILTAAPINIAALLIAFYLAQDIPATDMLRLNYSSRSRENVPDSLRSVSNLTKTGYTYLHPHNPDG